MSRSPQLTLIPRSLEPQETFVSGFAGLDADTSWEDGALPTGAALCAYSAFHLDLEQREGPM